MSAPNPSLLSLPHEIIDLILTHLVPSPDHLHSPTSPSGTTLASLRLTSSYFATSPLLFKLTFSYLSNFWLDETKSHRLISELGAEVCYGIHGGKWNVWALERVANEGSEEMKVGGVTFRGVVKRLGGVRITGAEDGDAREEDGKMVYTEKQISMAVRRLRLYRLLRRTEDAW